eukprot:411182-Amphidinium_carterae.1
MTLKAMEHCEIAPNSTFRFKRAANGEHLSTEIRWTYGHGWNREGRKLEGAQEHTESSSSMASTSSGANLNGH